MKKFMSILLTVLMIVLCSAHFYAFAGETLDEHKSGAISVSLAYPDTKLPIVNASVNLYRVGNVAEYDGELVYTLATGYTQSGASLVCDDSGNFTTGTAMVLANYVDKKNITGVSAKTNNDGTAYIGNCHIGLYLVIIQPAERTSEVVIDPFLVSVPLVQQGEYHYTVYANPKVSFGESPTDINGGGSDNPTKNEGTSVTNNNSTTTTNPTTSGINGSGDNTTHGSNNSGNGNNNYNNSNNNGSNNSSKPPQLPNTGMLKWPIPILATLGPLLFAYGYLDVTNRKVKDEN